MHSWLKFNRNSRSFHRCVSMKKTVDTNGRKIWPSRTSLGRLDKMENLWLDKTLSKAYFHKRSNSTVLVLPILPLSQLSMYHTELIIKKFNPDKMYSGIHSDQQLDSFYQNWLPIYHDSGSKIWWNEPRLFRDKMLNLTHELAKFKVPEKFYVPMVTIGVPFMGEVLTWQYLKADILSVPTNQARSLLGSGIDLNSSELDNLPKWTRYIDNPLVGIFERQLIQAKLDFIPSQRSLAQMIRRKRNIPNIKGLQNFISSLERTTVVTTPDESDRLDRLMRIWQKGKYLYLRKKPANNMYRNLEKLLNSLGSTRVEDRRYILVTVHRSLTSVFSRILDKNLESVVP